MKPVIIAGPCVIESQECLEEVAQELVRLNKNTVLILSSNHLLIKPIGLLSNHFVVQV